MCNLAYAAADSVPLQANGAGAIADELEDLQLGGSNASGAATPSPTAIAAARGAIDLPALAAPLLLQRSPAARTLYWKLLLAPLPPLHAGSGIAARQPEQQRLQHLHSWLALQLRCGRPVAASTGSAFVEGPVSLRMAVNGDGAVTATADLATCVVSPNSTGGCSGALSGASGIILAVPGGSAAASPQQLQQQLQQWSSAAVPLPTLLVAGTDAAAQLWQEAASASHLPPGGPVLVVSVVSVQEELAAAAISSAATHSAWGSAQQGTGAAPATYSRQRLVQGLRWVAAHSPPQPMLKVRCWGPPSACVQPALPLRNPGNRLGLELREHPILMFADRTGRSAGSRRTGSDQRAPAALPGRCCRGPGSRNAALRRAEAGPGSVGASGRVSMACLCLLFADAMPAFNAVCSILYQISI